MGEDLHIILDEYFRQRLAEVHEIRAAEQLLEEIFALAPALEEEVKRLRAGSRVVPIASHPSFGRGR